METCSSILFSEADTIIAHLASIIIAIWERLLVDDVSSLVLEYNLSILEFLIEDFTKSHALLRRHVPFHRRKDNILYLSCLFGMTFARQMAVGRLNPSPIAPTIDFL